MFPAVLYSTKHKTINGKCPFLPLLGTDVCQNVWCMNRSLFGKLSFSFIHSMIKINIYCNYVFPKKLNLLLYGLIGLSWLHVYNIAYWNMSWDIIWKKDNVGRCVYWQFLVSTMLAKTLGSLGKCIDHSSMKLVFSLVPCKEYNYQM